MNRRALLAAAATAAVAGCADALDGPDAAEAESMIVDHINDARESAGGGSLAVDDDLRAAARDHSRDMYDRGFFDHVDPNGRGPDDRVACRAGETLHSGDLGTMQNIDGSETWNTRQTDELAGYVDEGWRNSQQHREILVDPAWRWVGVGVYIGDDEFFVTAKFC